jgi:hypothetical protein
MPPKIPAAWGLAAVAAATAAFWLVSSLSVRSSAGPKEFGPPKRTFVASLVEALNDNDDATAWLNLGFMGASDTHVS